MSTLIIFDGNAVAHRAFHALPPLTTPNGESINAVYGMISVLLKIIADFSPTHIAFAFDTPEPTFRKKELPEYQANRPDMDLGLSSQFEKMYRTLDALQIPYFKVPGFEADDVIGTLAKNATEAGLETVIVTGDRDLFQLVNDKVKIFMPTKGVSEGKLYGAAEVVERMGVSPSQIVDLKALTGDASDNYKGVPGFGPKTALKLLDQYSNLESIYDHLTDLPEKMAAKLTEHRDSALLSQKLAQIVTDVSLDYSFDTMKKWSLGGDEVVTLFGQFGFNTLTKRTIDLAKKLESDKQGALF